VETAVVAPLVVTAMLGMMEIGYAFMICQTVTLASREGCRAGALPGGVLADVEEAVDDTMGAANLTGYTTESNIASLEPTDTEVWVEVSIPFSRVSFTGQLLGGGSFEISSRTTMRREGVEAAEEG
jgi:hypothetical protein